MRPQKVNRKSLLVTVRDIRIRKHGEAAIKELPACVLQVLLVKCHVSEHQL